MLSLPAGTSECERGFSQMKITKTLYRNKLKSTTMTMLLTTQLHSPDISNFDPAPVVHHWNMSASKRRPSFLRRTRRNDQYTLETALEDAQAASGVASQVCSSPVAATDDQAKDSDYDSTDFSDLDSDQCEMSEADSQAD